MAPDLIKLSRIYEWKAEDGEQAKPEYYRILRQWAKAVGGKMITFLPVEIKEGVARLRVTCRTRKSSYEKYLAANGLAPETCD